MILKQRPAETPRFSERFEEETGRWRLRYFLHSGFQDYEGKKCTTYIVRLATGVDEERLHSFLKERLSGSEMPPIVPEASCGRTLKMFREAEGAGLVSLEIACESYR